MSIFKKLFLVGFAIAISLFLILPQASLADVIGEQESKSLSNQKDSKVETNTDKLNETKVEVNGENLNEAQLSGIPVGGGLATCKTSGIEVWCDIDLYSLDPISYADVTVTYYKFQDLGQVVWETDSLDHFTKGSSNLYHDQSHTYLVPGKYKVKVTGLMWSYSDSPLEVKSFWSPTFTVTR